MAYHEMSGDELDRFLHGSPARPAVLATVRSDGRPHAVPIWYAVDEDGVIVFNTGAATVKGRNLLHDGRAALCLQDDAPPYAFATIEGTVTLSDDLAEVRRWATVIGGRYMGEDRAEEFGARNGVAGELVVRLTPERVIAAAELAG